MSPNPIMTAKENEKTEIAANAADSKVIEVEVENSSPAVRDVVRPPIVYSSPKAFFRSVGARLRSIFTRRFILALLAGQLVSLCITCTTVSTTELVNRGWTLSTSQGFFLYVLLFPCPPNALIPFQLLFVVCGLYPGHNLQL